MDPHQKLDLTLHGRSQLCILLATLAMDYCLNAPGAEFMKTLSKTSWDGKCEDSEGTCSLAWASSSRLANAQGSMTHHAVQATHMPRDKTVVASAGELDMFLCAGMWEEGEARRV